MAQQTTRSGCAGDLLALFVVVGLSWYLPHRLGGGWLAFLACFGAAVPTEWVHVLVHELGHLLTALAMRLPVTEFSVAASPSTWIRTWAGVRVQIGLAGRRSRIRVGEVSGRSLLAARMVAVSLAGPAANLIVAALAAAAAHGISLTTGKAVFLMVAAMALLRALANLLPIPSLPHHSVVRIEVLSGATRPVAATADQREQVPVGSVEVAEADEELRLLFDSGSALDERVLREQFAF